MNIKDFLNLIYKYKWLIIAIPVITLFVTFLFVKNLPKEYKSQAKLSTGLLDPSRQVAPDVPSYSGPDIMLKLNQQFTNIMELMKMSSNMSILSYRLILHDLKNPNKPFKPLSNDIKALTQQQKNEAVMLFEKRLEKRQVLTPLDNNEAKLYNLVKSMAYDEGSLSKKLAINHELNSDFITVEFTSENTFLSIFVVNTLSHDFITNYSADIIGNKNESILVLDSLLRKKEVVMNEKVEQLKDYKIRNGVLNLDKQSQITYQQITDSENKKNQALIDKQALQAALKNVNDNLNNRYNDKYLGAEVSKDNQAILNLKSKVATAEIAYLDGGYKPNDKKKVDSLQLLLSAQLVKSNDNYLSDPLIAKQTLIQRRIAIGIDLDKTTAGIKDIDNELSKLNAKFTQMVPFDAGVQKYEQNADVATKEYLELLTRYNQTNLDKNIGLRLQIVEAGVPTSPESSKKALYMALSVVASFAICFCLLFIIHILDHSINDEKELKKVTNAKVLGELNFIKPKDRDIETIWKQDFDVGDYITYKNLLRATRFEVNKLTNLEDKKILGITSLTSEKFKLFSVVSLAYALASIDKKILLIGGHEFDESLAKLNVPTNQSIKNVLEGLPIQKNNNITFLNRDLNGESLLENKDKTTIASTFNAIKKEFDLVIINLDPIDSVSDIKEWVSFTDVYIATFMAGTSIGDNEKKKMLALNDDEKFAGWIINGVKQS